MAILRRPVYAGYYSYGERQTDPRRRQAGRRWSGRVVVAREEYLALIPDKIPAYISRERYEVNQGRLAENRARIDSKGAAREGPSLLAGLVVCGRCGKRMTVHYAGRGQVLRYTCRSGAGNLRGTCSHSLAGRVLDQLVVVQVLAALEPGALELSLAAGEDVIRERAALDETRRQQLERARAAAARAERQYQATEPENRLVGRTLERRWEEALQEVRVLEEEYARFRQSQPTALSRAEVEQIRSLACDLPGLWDAATTRAADRQEVIRFLVDRVEVAVEGVSDRVGVTITWLGGQATRHELSRPVGRYEQAADFERLMARVEELRALGHSFRVIAEHLNGEGYRPPKGAGRFHGDMVNRLVRRRTAGDTPAGAVVGGVLGQDEWCVIDLARRLGIGKNRLHGWLGRGWVVFRRLPGYRGRCVCWADGEELARLGQLGRASGDWWDPPSSELTTPKRRP